MPISKKTVFDQHASISVMLTDIVKKLDTPPHLLLVDLARLIHATRHHFADEETMMLTHQYFDYAGQMIAHAKFLKLLDSIYAAAIDDPRIIPHRVGLIADAILSHIKLEEPLFDIEISNDKDNQIDN